MTNNIRERVTAQINACTVALQNEELTRITEDGMDFVDSIGLILRYCAVAISHLALDTTFLTPDANTIEAFRVMKPYMEIPLFPHV
jgi:hypothetical protein